MHSKISIDYDDLEDVLMHCPQILEKVKDDCYAQNLYAAMCNIEWQRLEVVPILKEKIWSCSWRYAGGIVASMRKQGDYLEWYCSGIYGASSWADEEAILGYVVEGVVTDEIKHDLRNIGWFPIV